VILLENSNEWNLSRTKEGPSKKKKRSKDWKAKEVKPHLKSYMSLERKKGWDLQAVGRDSIEKERKEITFFL
jgi:hypothetical protein